MASNPLKNLAGQTMVYGLGTIVPRLLNYLLVPYYTRVFEQGVYGQITELYAYVAFLLVFLTYGMETAFFRYAQKNDVSKVFNNIFSLIIVTTTAFLLIMSLSYSFLADLIQYSGNAEYILFIGLIVALDAATAVPFALLRKQNKARKFATIKLVNVVLNVSLNLLFLTVFPKFSLQLAQDLFGPGASLLVWVFIINFVSSLVSLLMLFPSMTKYRWQLDFTFLKPVLVYALPVLVLGLAGMVNEVIDKILLKYLLPDSSTAMQQLGIYGANYKLGVLMTLFIQMFRYASEPFFFAQSDTKDSKILFARVMNYFVIAGLIIFLVVTLYLDVFKGLISKNYHEGLGIVPIVLLANLFNGIFFNLSIWYKLTDRTLEAAVISILGAVITIILLVLLIPIIGYLGAAWAHLACYFFMMSVSYLCGNKVYPIPYQVGRIGGYLLAAITIYFFSLEFAMINPFLKYTANTFLFLTFIGSAFFIERKYQIKPSF